MPLRPFNGNTFVAFCDIAGFKAALKDSQERAAKMLDAFYSSGFNAIRNQQQHGLNVDGLFVSDCGVLFAREGNEIDQLQAMCAVLTEIHRACHENIVPLATSIAYGRFECNDRYVIPGIEKNLFLGSAYLTAFADQSAGTPKLFHPEIRLLKTNLPQPVTDVCSDQHAALGAKMRNAGNHFYFEWQRPNGHRP
jgi:hypothetical protein